MNKRENAMSLLNAITGGIVATLGGVLLIFGLGGGIPSLLQSVHNGNLLDRSINWFLVVLFGGGGALCLLIGIKPIWSRMKTEKEMERIEQQRQGDLDKKEGQCEEKIAVKSKATSLKNELRYVVGGLAGVFGVLFMVGSMFLIPIISSMNGITVMVLFVTIACVLFFASWKLTRRKEDYFEQSMESQIVAEICVEEDENQQLDEYDVEYVDGMEGHEFEYFCAELLEKNGFTEVLVTQGSGDQGVDIVAVKDDVRYAIQCKNYASKLGNTPVQEVSAGKIYYNCDIGVVLTNSTFTPGAIELAKATNIRLWDRDVLQKLMTAAKEKK